MYSARINIYWMFNRWHENKDKYPEILWKIDWPLSLVKVYNQSAFVVGWKQIAYKLTHEDTILSLCTRGLIGYIGFCDEKGAEPKIEVSATYIELKRENDIYTKWKKSEWVSEWVRRETVRVLNRSLISLRISKQCETKRESHRLWGSVVVRKQKDPDRFLSYTVVCTRRTTWRRWWIKEEKKNSKQASK